MTDEEKDKLIQISKQAQRDALLKHIDKTIEAWIKGTLTDREALLNIFLSMRK